MVERYKSRLHLLPPCLPKFILIVLLHIVNAAFAQTWVSPADAETVYRGTTYVVQWNRTAVASTGVGLALVPSDVADPVPLNSSWVLVSGISNDGEYTWSMPATLPVGQYYFCVFDHESYEILLRSSGSFSVAKPSITMVKPIVDDCRLAGAESTEIPFTVEWALPSGVEGYSVELVVTNVDTGAVTRRVAVSSPPYTYSFQPPLDDSGTQYAEGRYSFTVTSSLESDVTASSAVITVTNSAGVTFLEPLAALLYLWSPIPIRFACGNITGAVQLWMEMEGRPFLLLNDTLTCTRGRELQHLLDDVEADGTAYAPGVYRLVVLYHQDAATYGSYGPRRFPSQDFALAVPGVSVTSPADGQHVYRGSTYCIAWTGPSSTTLAAVTLNVALTTNASVALVANETHVVSDVVGGQEVVRVLQLADNAVPGEYLITVQSQLDSRAVGLAYITLDQSPTQAWWNSLVVEVTVNASIDTFTAAAWSAMRSTAADQLAILAHRILLSSQASHPRAGSIVLVLEIRDSGGDAHRVSSQVKSLLANGTPLFGTAFPVIAWRVYQEPMEPSDSLRRVAMIVGCSLGAVVVVLAIGVAIMYVGSRRQLDRLRKRVAQQIHESRGQRQAAATDAPPLRSTAEIEMDRYAVEPTAPEAVDLYLKT